MRMNLPGSTLIAQEMMDHKTSFQSIWYNAYSGLMSASYSGDTRPPLLYIAKISIFLSHGITFESEAYRFVNNSI